MKVCPKCKYVETENWRTLRYVQQVEYLEWGDFKEAYPKIAKQLVSSNYVQDENYAYRRAGKSKNFVHRIYIELWKAYGKRAFHPIPSEKVEHHKDIFQKKLFKTEGGGGLKQ